MKKLLFITIFILAFAFQYAFAQSSNQDCQSKLETANQRIVKLAENLTLVNAELKTAKEKEALQKELNAELLNLLKEYASLPPKEKKGFWKKVQAKLTGFLDKATEPDMLARIATILIILDKRN